MPGKMPITTIDAYIRTFPDDVQEVLEKTRQAIREAAPEAAETMSYGMPTFDLHGEHLVFFAGWKQHIPLYPLPAGDDSFQQRIAQYKTAKSTLRFPLDEPVPYDLIGEVVSLLESERARGSTPDDR
jgi:uncharacterized protein YdhG (YjbR/CyaY superfamily)